MSALRAYLRNARPGRDGISKPTVSTVGMAIVKKRVPEPASRAKGRQMNVGPDARPGRDGISKPSVLALGT